MLLGFRNRKQEAQLLIKGTRPGLFKTTWQLPGQTCGLYFPGGKSKSLKTKNDWSPFTRFCLCGLPCRVFDLTLCHMYHFAVDRGGDDRVGQVLQVPPESITQGLEVQLLQVCKHREQSAAML